MLIHWFPEKFAVSSYATEVRRDRLRGANAIFVSSSWDCCFFDTDLTSLLASMEAPVAGHMWNEGRESESSIPTRFCGGAAASVARTKVPLGRSLVA